MSSNIFDVLEDFDDFNNTFYRSSTSVDIDEQDIVDEEDHVPNNKAKKRRRRRFWHQRDSLARRNRLLMGKEGSRRRQRWDNNHFTDHPFAVFDEADIHMMEHIHQPSFHWVSDDPQVIAILESEDMDDILLASQEHLHQIDQRQHAAAAVPLTRNLRRILRTRKISPGIVNFYEEQILSFIEHLQRLDGVYAADPDEVCLALDIADGYARWIVHIMCEYYQLVSFSKTLRDRRILFICHPLHRAWTQDDSSDDCVFIDTETLNHFWRLPPQRFSEYLFPAT